MCFNNRLQSFILCYFNDSFYTLHSMTLFSPSFLHELLFNNLNWASEVNPILGFSTEISRDIYMCVGRSVGNVCCVESA